MKSIVYFTCLIMVMFSISCASTKPFEAPKLEPAKFEPTEKYKLDLTPLENAKPTPPVPVYAVMDEKKQTITITNDPKNANSVVFTTAEYAKVGSVIKIAATYKEVAIQEEALINLRIDEINSLKQLVAIKDAQIAVYRDMYMESMKLYNEERRQHHRDNVRHDIKEVIMFGGAIALVCAL